MERMQADEHCFFLGMFQMACSARTGTQSNSNVDTMLSNMPGSSSNNSASHCQHNISNDEVSDSVF